MPPLKNPRRERFCLEYVRTGNATQSWISAGYAPANADGHAAVAVVNRSIKARIAELRKPLEAGAHTDILSIAERKELLSALGKRKPEVPISAGHVLGAIAELNKMEGTYAPMKQDIIVKTGYQSIPDAELEAIIAEAERLVRPKRTPSSPDNS